MKFIYMTTAGRADPTRAAVGINMAVNGSAEVGHDTAVVFAGDATDLLVGDGPAGVQGLGLPPMSDLIAKVFEKTTVYI